MFLTPFGTTVHRSPFRDLERLVEELHATFNGTGQGGRGERQHDIPLNLWSNDHGLELTAEIPGIDPASITVNVLGDTVTIAGKRQAGSHQPASFSRTVHLPYRVDAERTEARSSEGVLTIALRRPEAELPRAITVKPA